MNLKNHNVCSNKFQLSVLDLTCVHLATDEDRQYHIDHWATLFKAKTWEDIKVLAQNNEYIATASNTIFKLTQEEQIRLQCEARGDFYRRQRSVQKQLQNAETENARLKEEIERLKALLAQRMK